MSRGTFEVWRDGVRVAVFRGEPAKAEAAARKLAATMSDPPVAFVREGSFLGGLAAHVGLVEGAGLAAMLVIFVLLFGWPF